MFRMCDREKLPNPVQEAKSDSKEFEWAPSEACLDGENDARQHKKAFDEPFNRRPKERRESCAHPTKNTVLANKRSQSAPG